MYGDSLLPSLRFAEDSPLDRFLAKYIQCILATQAAIVHGITKSQIDL
jgi:hypothetical protein